MDAGTVDWDRLVRHVGTDPSFLREILTLFLAQKEKHVPSVRKALSEGDRDLLVSAAHALKGVVGNLCAPSVFEQASWFEECARRGDFPAANDSWPRLEAGLDELVLEFQRKLR